MGVLAAAFGVWLALSGAVRAGPLDDALAAYEQDDYATALALWRPLAEEGNARAQSSLGFMYSNGNGVPLDYAQAATWYQRAAVQGDSLAQGSLGFLYEHGQGVPRDPIRAYAWFSAAAASSAGALHDLFARDRDRVAARLSPQQIAEARQLAHAWDGAQPRR